MNYNKLFIESYTSIKIEIQEKYIDNKDVCENLAFVFCGCVLIPFIKEKYLQDELEDVKSILEITSRILEMNIKELNNIIYMGILENIIPEREMFTYIKSIMSTELLNISKDLEKKLGW